MPSEIRHLLFRPSEVVQAIKEYHHRLKRWLPSGTIVRCGPETDGSGGAVRFRVTIVPDLVAEGSHRKIGEGPPQDVVMEGPPLAAALILYCHTLHIPLPARAEKTLQLMGNQICLVVVLAQKADPVEDKTRAQRMA